MTKRTRRTAVMSSSHLLLLRRGRNHALEAEIGNQIAVVLVVVANLADERPGARHLPAAEWILDQLAGRGIRERCVGAVAIGDGIGGGLHNGRLGPGSLLEVVLGKRTLLPPRGRAGLIAVARHV